MSNVIHELKSLIKEQPDNPLRPEQVRLLQEEDARLTAVIQAPKWLEGMNRGEAAKSRARVRKMLENTAKPIDDGPRRDKVARLTVEAIDTEIKPRLLPRSVMRRNPAGAVDQFIHRENSREAKQAVSTVRRAMRALEPENEDLNYTNMERFRSEGLGEGGTATFMAEAQIPGSFAMTLKAKENWPLGEPTVETPLKTAQKRELSEKQKAGLLKAQEARRANIAARKAAVNTQPTEGHEVPVPKVTENTSGVSVEIQE